MIGALLYLQFHSIANRLLMRLKRLKQPKYLFGAIVGGLYFYYYFYRWLFRAHGARSSFIGNFSAEDQLLYELLGALFLFVILLMSWVIPHERAALAFTEAEVAFLFPAPISRRGLIHFKLLRSQTAILFTTLFLTLVTSRTGGRAWIRAAGWWVLLCTLNLHFLGSSFSRTILLDRGITNWQRRGAIFLLVGLAITGIVLWARYALPALPGADWTDLDAVKDYLCRVLTSGPARWLLYPLRLVVRPYLAPNGSAFLSVFPAALAVLLVHYWWVLRSDVSFEEASVEASRRLAERVADLRAGRSKRRGRRAPFRLRPTGPAATALLWKNLINAGQAFSLRTWITLAAIGFGASLGMRGGLGDSGFRPALAIMVVIFLAGSWILGPQFLRQDFRQDLPLTDMLKVLPMRGWQVALGELLAPVAILSGIQWILLLIAAGLFSNLHGLEQLSPARLIAGAVGAAFLAPLLNLITLQIPNAAVLLLPAWSQTGKDSAHGIETTGQRLILLFGQMVVLAVALVPAAVLAMMFFVLGNNLGTVFAILVAALGAAVVLAVEAFLGLLFLGYLFERFDMSAELK